MLYENTFLLVTGKCFLHSPESLFVVSYDLLRPRLFQSWDKPHVGPASWALLRQLHDRASITPPLHPMMCCMPTVLACGTHVRLSQESVP